MGKENNQKSTGSLTIDKIDIQPPKKYKVVFFNDDVTTMDFVVFVLMKIFNLGSLEATKVMYDVHQNGKAVAGVYPKDIAFTKVELTRKLASNEGFPLRVSVEVE